MVPIDRKWLALFMEAAYIYMGMRRFKEAKDVLEGLTAIARDSEIPWVALGGVDFCQGRFDEAIRTYKRALKQNPESLFAKAYLAEALFFAGQKSESLLLLKEVSRQEPQGPTGDFCRALLDAMDRGFDPQTLSHVKEIEAYYAKKRKEVHT